MARSRVSKPATANPAKIRKPVNGSKKPLTMAQLQQQLPADQRPFVKPSGPKFIVRPDTVTLVLPPPHAALNAHQGGQWQKKRMVVAALRFLAKETCQSATRVRWPAALITYAFYFPDARQRDEVNAMQSLKGAIDGIVDAGLIPDDDHVHLHVERVAVRMDPGNPRTELTFRKTTVGAISKLNQEPL